MELTRRQTRRLRCRIPGGDRAPGEARKILDRFDPTLEGRRRDDARLLLSEIVNNSVRHAGAGPDETVELTLSRSPRKLRVTVADDGGGFDQDAAREPPDAEREGGRGLFLLDSIADRWGVVNGRVTRVWFELTP
jgi:anti-sigma regulatory factor (Ser/Thr protein kinase)